MSKILIKSVDGKIPRDIGKFFSNNQNKTRLIDLTFDYIKRNTVQCLALLKSNVVVLHAIRFLLENKEESVCIRSPSGDTNILVIALGTIIEISRVVFDDDIVGRPVTSSLQNQGFHACNVILMLQTM